METSPKMLMNSVSGEVMVVPFIRLDAAPAKRFRKYYFPVTATLVRFNGARAACGTSILKNPLR